MNTKITLKASALLLLFTAGLVGFCRGETLKTRWTISEDNNGASYAVRVELFKIKGAEESLVTGIGVTQLWGKEAQTATVIDGDLKVSLAVKPHGNGSDRRVMCSVSVEPSPDVNIVAETVLQIGKDSSVAAAGQPAASGPGIGVR